MYFLHFAGAAGSAPVCKTHLPAFAVVQGSKHTWVDPVNTTHSKKKPLHIFGVQTDMNTVLLTPNREGAAHKTRQRAAAIPVHPSYRTASQWPHTYTEHRTVAANPTVVLLPKHQSRTAVTPMHTSSHNMHWMVCIIGSQYISSLVSPLYPLEHFLNTHSV